MSIKYAGESRTFHLQTNSTSYIMYVMGSGLLANIYYGSRVEETPLHLIQYRDISCKSKPEFAEQEGLGFSYDVIGMEYPTYGVGDLREHAVEIEDKDGVHAVDLRYKSHTIYAGKKALEGLPSAYDDGEKSVSSLEIVMQDYKTGVEVVLTYSVFEKCDAIVKSVSVVNKSADDLVIHRCLSSSAELPDGQYTAVYLCGAHARERFITETEHSCGRIVVDSIQGGTSHDKNCFMALKQSGASEDCGSVYGAALVYSGNFAMIADKNTFGKTRLLCGINPTGFSWQLKSGEKFVTPEAVLVYSDKGMGGISRSYHDFIRRHICRGAWRDKKRPLLINNWEGTRFDFDGQKIIDIAKVAKKMGLEMLVLDDGWFGHRDNDRSSLGDWFENKQKLGMSIGELAQAINDMGLKFGLWFEPEMISVDSELYKKHPDYAFHIDGRPLVYGRHQLTLNFARKEVVDNIYDQLCKVLSSANISYVKWDMNRFMADVCSYELGRGRQTEVYHRYMLGLYGLLDRLTKKFPDILFESCAGGGGRFDMGLLCYMPQTWTSDNTDPYERLFIQTGTSLVYPVRTMGAHVNAGDIHGGRRTSIKARADVAMCGTFGYELDLTKLSDDQIAEMREANERYHKYYDLIQFGDYYRDISIYDTHGLASAVNFVSKDKSEALIVFAKARGIANQLKILIKPKGLDPDAVYLHTETGDRYLGSTLMNMGIYYGKLTSGEVNTWTAHFERVD